MISTEQLVETAFQPGNLVHGTDIIQLPEVVERGVETGWRYKSTTPTPYEICFALLSSRPLQDRYNDAQHKGPNSTRKDSIFPAVSILVNRVRLLERFPGSLKAVGQIFWDNDMRSALEHNYDYNVENNVVFGIPIEKPEGRFWMFDEVRFSTGPHTTPQLEPDLWEGLVVKPESLDRILEVISLAQRKIHLPIFSPETELLLATTLVFLETGDSIF